MGTEEVLHRTRTMSWGCDTALYQTVEAMRAELPARLATGPRVIKRNRGNGGQGVWKVETLSGLRSQPMVRVLDATKDASEELTLDEFLGRCVEYFEDGGVIDQPFQARLTEGVVRCYMAGDRCSEGQGPGRGARRAPRPEDGSTLPIPIRASSACAGLWKTSGRRS